MTILILPTIFFVVYGIANIIFYIKNNKK